MNERGCNDKRRRNKPEAITITKQKKISKYLLVVKRKHCMNMIINREEIKK